MSGARSPALENSEFVRVSSHTIHGRKPANWLEKTTSHQKWKTKIVQGGLSDTDTQVRRWEWWAICRTTNSRWHFKSLDLSCWEKAESESKQAQKQVLLLILRLQTSDRLHLAPCARMCKTLTFPSSSRRFCLVIYSSTGGEQAIQACLPICCCFTL